MNLAAADALQKGNLAAAQAQLKGSQTIGAAKTAFATAGVDTQSGSALHAMVDSRMMSELDAATLRNSAAREAWGYKVKGMEAYQQGLANSQKEMTAGASLLASGAESDVSTGISLGSSFKKV
jgi:hypothetical protein